MPLVSGASSVNHAGSRPARIDAPRRSRLGMLLAAGLSLVLTGTAVAQSPSPDPTGAISPTLTLEGTEWVLRETGVESLAGTATLLLQDGTATGNDGCNDYFAPYTVSGSALSFGPIGVTYPPVTCAETPTKFEAVYFGLLASVSSYLLIESSLTLIDDTGSPALSFAAEPVSPVVGAWVVTGYRGADGAFGEPVEGSVLTLSLEPDGVANGFTGCDRFDGTYVLDTDTIQFGALTSSTVPCGSTSLQDQQEAYRSALAAVRTWTYTEYGLKLRDEAGTTQVSLVVAPAPLFARAWVPTGIADLDGTLLPPVDGSDPVLDFHGDGQLTGNTGCNSVFGEYQVSGPLIDIRLVAMTRTICVSDSLNVQEAAYVDALDSATSWTLDDLDLVLLGSTGSTLMTLVTQPDVIPVPTATPSIDIPIQSSAIGSQGMRRDCSPGVARHRRDTSDIVTSHGGHMTEPRGPNPLGLPRQPEPVPGEGPTWSPGTGAPRVPLDIPNDPDPGSFGLPQEVPDEPDGSLDLPAVMDPAL